MTQLFTTLLAGLGVAATGGVGAAAGGAAAAGAGAAAAGGLSFGSILSIGSTVVGGLASMAAGNQQKAALYNQARDEETRAVQETINGRQEAITAMRKLNSDLSKITVAGFASGLSPTGSVVSAQNAAIQQGEQNVNMARENAAFAAAQRRGQAKQLRAEGDGAAQQGIFSAISGGLGLFSRQNNRGY